MYIYIYIYVCTHICKYSAEHHDRLQRDFLALPFTVEQPLGVADHPRHHDAYNIEYNICVYIYVCVHMHV